MADDVTVDNGAGSDYIVSTEELADASHVQNIQLVTVSGTASTDLAKAEDAIHASGDMGIQILAVRKDSAIALAADGDYLPLITDSAGRLHVAPLPAGAENIGSVSVLDVTPGTGATDLGKAEDSLHNSGDVGVMTLAVRKDTAVSVASDGEYQPLIVDSLGRLHVNIGSIPAASKSTDSIAAVLAADTAPPTGFTALSALKLISAASTNATSVKASAGQLYWLHVVSTNAAVRYLKLYNKASAPTVGTDVPVHTFTIPGGTGGAGFVLAFPVPITFATGIALALTTGVADADTGAVAANEIVVNGGYR